jgi:hypothetical protein
VSRLFWLHPLLFALYPPLFLYSRNRGLVAFRELLVPLLLIWTLTILGGLIAIALYRDRHRGALFLSAALMACFGYGHLKLLLHDRLPRLSALRIGPNTLILFGLLVILVLAALVLRSRNLRTSSATSAANVTAVALTLLAVLSAPPVERASALPVTGSSSGGKGYKPSIVYVVVDGYPGSEALKDVLGFDNSRFLDRLRSLGFHVASGSRANYGHTVESLASALNWTYLPPDADEPALAQWIRRNRAAEFLRAKRYTTVAFASGLAAIDRGEWDVYLDQSGGGEFKTLLLALTPIPDIARRLGIERDLRHEAHRHRLLYILDKLPDVIRVQQPVFVLAHVISPHPPYVFGRNGETIEPDPTFGIGDNSGWAPRNRGKYLAQLQYLNGRLISLLGKIREVSPEAVIILHSDHGSAFRISTGQRDSEAARERLSILYAHYIPEQMPKRPYATRTPVNTLPILLNTLFDADLPLQEDRSYWRNGRRLEEVTDLLRDE